MSRLAAFVLLLLATALPAAPVPKEAAAPPKFDSTWKVVSIVTKGEPATDGVETMHWTIDAAGLLTKHHGSTPPAKSDSETRVKFDPKSNVLDYYWGPTLYRAIYELKGDSLLICCALAGGERPRTIAAGPTVYLWTLKRVKSEEKK